MRLVSIVPGIATLLVAGSAFAAPHHTPTPTPAPASASPTPFPWESGSDTSTHSSETTTTTTTTTPTTSPRVASASSSSSSSGEPGASGSGPLNLAPSEATTYRPTGRSIGIGFGYTMPGTSFSTPNTISARLQLSQTLTLEPIARLDISSSSGKVDTAKTSNTGFDLFAGTALRKRLAARQMVDAVGILEAGVGVNTTSGKAGGVSTSSSSVGLTTGWGLGAEFWPKQHWSISLDATNPLISVSSTSGKQPDPTTGTIVKTSNTSIFAGAVWDPSVVLMTHLYY